MNSMSQSVSVLVLTYNTANFVIETLESVFNQTYANIQLIISDDFSKDNTVFLVESWCKQPRVQSRFKDIKILTVPKNTGVSANCNRAAKTATSQWIKFIAGDDILLSNCITDNIDFITKQPQASVVFSQVNVYQDTFIQVNYQKSMPQEFPINLMDFDFSAKNQFRILLESDRITYTPSSFFNKKAIESVGYFDESDKLVEDYPMWLKLTGAGIRLHYFHKPTVGYRIHANATNNTGDSLFKPSEINGYLVRKKYAHPHLSWIKRKEEGWKYSVTKIFQYFNVNKPSSINKMVYKAATVYLNPFFYIGAVARRL